MSVEESRLPLEAEAKAPGKLYIAGEYAVVQQGHPAILVAVDRWLTVRITELKTNGGSVATAQSRGVETEMLGGRSSSGVAEAVPSPYAGVEPVGHIHSEGHPEASVTWRRRGGHAVPDLEQPGAAFVLEAIHSVEQLAVLAGRDLRMYDVNIVSELDDAQSGRKFGLGSSAAVTVATVRALVRFYGLDLGPMQLYKLAFAAISHAQKVGSGGDIAASLFGGCIRFTAVDRQWVTRRLQDTTLAELIDMPWPSLSVARVDALAAPHSMRLMVGWTGSPASTTALVGQVQQASATEHERLYQSFLKSSDACVDALIAALERDDAKAVGRYIAQARTLLGKLSAFTGTLIETPKLAKLIEIALAHGAPAKSSGAGGGDCGIAIASEGAQPDLIEREWRQNGILPLDMNVTEPLLEVRSWGERAYAQGAGLNRKDDHIRLALGQHEHEGRNAFDDLRFVHHSLASVSLDQVDTRVEVCGSTWSQPFYINAMTGGSTRAGEINEALGRVAGATGLAIASGSQHAALRDPKFTGTFTSIREHTDGFVFANIGPDVTPEQAVAAVEMLHADALQIHLNAAQEIVMPEGSRDFSVWPEHIRRIVETSPVPVVVKEVGFGMSPETVSRLATLGVHTVDVSGRGGTDFAAIENGRRRFHEYGYLDGWGQSTVLCLLGLAGEQHGVADITEKLDKSNNYDYANSTEARCVGGSADEAADDLLLMDGLVSSESGVDADAGFGAGTDGSPAKAGSAGKVDVLASGGVRNPLDVVKALALGAKAVGVSGHFLHILAGQGEQALIDEIGRWADEVRSLMALLGARSVADLAHTDVLVCGKSAEEARLLDVDLRYFAHRSRQTAD